jgi:hypothetical protein
LEFDFFVVSEIYKEFPDADQDEGMERNRKWVVVIFAGWNNRKGGPYR